MGRTEQAKTTSELSRADAANDAKKVAATPRATSAGKAPVSLAKSGARATQGGKAPFSLQQQRNKLLAAQKDKPVSRLSAKSAKKEKEPRAVKKRKRSHAASEIRKQQQEVGFAIPRAAFTRVTREVVNEVSPEVALRFTKDALLALQCHAEEEFIKLFTFGGRLSCLQRHKMLMGKTFDVAVRTFQEMGVPWYQVKSLGPERFLWHTDRKTGKQTWVGQIRGKAQIDDFKAEVAAYNKLKKMSRKPRVRKSAAPPADVDADEPVADEAKPVEADEAEVFSEPGAVADEE